MYDGDQTFDTQWDAVTQFIEGETSTPSLPNTTLAPVPPAQPEPVSDSGLLIPPSPVIATARERDNEIADLRTQLAVQRQTEQQQTLTIMQLKHQLDLARKELEATKAAVARSLDGSGVVCAPTFSVLPSGGRLWRQQSWLNRAMCVGWIGGDRRARIRPRGS